MVNKICLFLCCLVKPTEHDGVIQVAIFENCKIRQRKGIVCNHRMTLQVLSIEFMMCHILSNELGQPEYPRAIKHECLILAGLLGLDALDHEDPVAFVPAEGHLPHRIGAQAE